MEIVIVASPEEVGVRAARRVAALVRRNPRAVLGLPTGETPKGMYAELVRMHREEGLDFSHVTTFNLDEFVGVPPDHPGSYHYYMHQHFVRHVNLDPARVHVPDGNAASLEAACDAYELAIARAGGIDLQVLGLGGEGHIGFNEPTSSLGSRTRIKTLTDDTMVASGSAWGAQGPPRHVITMGVATILGARQCLLLACGARKAKAVAAMVEGPLTARVPASALQLHPRACVLLDAAAAAALELADYYRAIERHKPDWQRRRDEG